MKRPNPERKARKVLRDLEISREPVDVFAVASSLGARVQMEPMAEAEISGALYRDEDPPIIGVNGRHHPNRQRFTIAHEIGHLLLHDDPVFVDRVFYRDGLASEGKDPQEIEANWFAAALLMPRDFVLRRVEEELQPLRADIVERLAADFEVSSQAMAFRLENLEVALDQT